MGPTTSPREEAAILVVDDTPESLQLLARKLRKQGYKVKPAASGSLALAAARREPPGLILLDINMPEMDGYEVCARLKGDDLLREIPVIFISALDEVMDKVKAFSVGGVDYVTKPFQFEEVQARVDAHLKLRRLQIELGERNRQLQANYERLRELEDLRDNLVHMIVHDMRTPLAAIRGLMDLLIGLEGPTLSEKANVYVARAHDTTESLLEMVNSLLDVSRMEAGKLVLHLEPCDLAAIAREAVQKAESLKGRRRLIRDVPDGPVGFIGDPGLIPRVLQNLVGNALKFTPDGGEIRVTVEPQGDRIRVAVCDNGPGIPPEYREKIFEKFGQAGGDAHKRKNSTGLGLTFCKLAVEAHGGSIGVDSVVGQGSTFWFVLPCKGPAAKA